MWFLALGLGSLITVAGIVYIIIMKIKAGHAGPIGLDWVIFTITVIVGVVIIVLSGGSGIRNYAQIPRIHQDIRLERVNKRHYKEAMGYNLGDESNERKSASHVRWFKDGDFSEANDNKTWKQNYHDWFYNKGLITYHRMQLKYYQHPLRNWRDGAGMSSLYNSVTHSNQ